MKTTKIKEVNLYRAVSPLNKPIADSTHSISKIAFYVAEVITEGGIKGQGYVLSFHYSPHAAEGALKDVKEFILGNDFKVEQTIRFNSMWRQESEYFGNKGINAAAGAVINIAMWDSWCRTLDAPIWKVLGCSAKKIPVYGSGGWISYTDEELLEEVLDYKARGFTAVKIKVGSGSIERDLERLTKCREALGSSVKIMMDANQGMDVNSAMTLARKASDLGITWFEEPLPNTDFAGYEILRRNCGIAIAMGEREYDFEALKQLISKNAIDLWQPDIVRLGGVEGWRDSAALAQGFGLPVLPHYYKDYDVPLLCTIENPFGAESFDWIDPIIDNQLNIENGFALPRDGSGFGFVFNESALEPF